MTASCIYSGWVMHRRLRPRRHHFRYRAWWLLLDLDEIDTLDARLRLFSRGRPNLTSFRDGDFGHDESDLRGQIAQRLADNAIEFDGGPIRLLCCPRVFGYQFNPLSIYFCYRRNGELAGMVYEVHNTFGERHSYCFAAQSDRSGNVRQSSAKQFYVSPFMGMGMRYDFRVTPPGDTVTVGIGGSEDERPLINAVLHGERRELCDRQLVLLLCTIPLVTLKVIGAIHLEALRLWWKGLKVHPHAARGHSKQDLERNHV